MISRAQRCNVPGIHEFLREMNEEVFSKYDILTVGEASRITHQLAPDYVRASRKELASLYHFDICRRLPLPPPVSHIKKAYENWARVVENDGWIAQYLTNHDFPRQVSRFGDDGKYRVQSAKLLATLIHTLPGSPYVYQGEEIGMTNVEFSDWEDRIELIHSDRIPNTPGSVVNMATCSYTDLIALDAHTAGLAYSDFTVKGENGTPRKTMMFRRIRCIP